MRPLLLLGLLLSVAFLSFKKPAGFVITAKLSGFPEGTMFYLRNLSTDEILDSAQIQQNKFTLKGRLSDTPEQLWLFTHVNDEFIFANLLIGNEKLSVSGDRKDFPASLAMRGSKTQDDYNREQNLTKELTAERKELVNNFFCQTQEQRKEGHPAFSAQLKTIDKTKDSLKLGFIKANPHTYTAAVSLGYMQEKLPKEEVQAIYNRFSPEVKASKYANAIAAYLRENILAKGDKFHDFTALDKTGKTVSFSEVTGKYVLLDFTAAFCGPCIQSAEELRLINRNYSDSLRIVSFSGDPKKEIWLKSLERDSVTWVSLWDGKGRFSETAIKYGVNGYPTFLLIDPQGIIIDAWSGYGKGMLQHKLKQFKNS